MASADFLQFVVTAHFFSNTSTQMRLQDLPGYSHVLSLFTRRIYRKRFRAAIGLCFALQTYPRFRPYMRFLFVRPEFCPLGDLSTPKIRLSSDSASRRTPLPLAIPSHCRVVSGLSPYRTCAHRAHNGNSSTVLLSQTRRAVIRRGRTPRCPPGGSPTPNTICSASLFPCCHWPADAGRSYCRCRTSPEASRWKHLFPSSHPTAYQK